MKVGILAASLAAIVLPACVKYRPHPLDPPASEREFRARSLTDDGLRAFLKRPDWPPAKLGLDDLTAAAYYFNGELEVARAQLRTSYDLLEARMADRTWAAGGFSLADCAASPALHYAWKVEPWA